MHTCRGVLRVPSPCHKISDVTTRGARQLGRATPEGEAFAWEKAAKVSSTFPHTP